MRETETRLHCDQCGDKSEWWDMAIFPLADIIATLRDQGWVRARGGRTRKAGDYCPKCSGKKPEFYVNGGRD